MVAAPGGPRQGHKAPLPDGPSTLPVVPPREDGVAMTPIIDLDHLGEVEVHLEAAATELQAQTDRLQPSG